MRKLSQRGQRRHDPSSECISEPHVTVAASGIAEFVFAHLTTESLSDGLMGRFLLLESADRGTRVDEPRDEQPPESLLKALWPLCNRGPSLFPPSFTSEDEARVVYFDDAAKRLRRELREEEDRLFNAVTGGEAEAKRALIGRLSEKAMKIALVLSVSDHPGNPVITEAHVRTGWEIAEASTNRLLYLAESYTSRNAYDERAKRLLRLVREHGSPILRSTLMKQMHESVKDFDEVLNTLQESGQIVVRENVKTGGRPGTVISLA